MKENPKKKFEGEFDESLSTLKNFPEEWWIWNLFHAVESSSPTAAVVVVCEEKIVEDSKGSKS